MRAVAVNTKSKSNQAKKWTITRSHTFIATTALSGCFREVMPNRCIWKNSGTADQWGFSDELTVSIVIATKKSISRVLFWPLQLLPDVAFAYFYVYAPISFRFAMAYWGSLGRAT